LFRVPLLFIEFSKLLMWTSVSSNIHVSCGSAFPLVDGKWSIISLMALGPITTCDSFQASGTWRCNWDDGVCSVNRCVFTIPDDVYRMFVSVKTRHANIVKTSPCLQCKRTINFPSKPSKSSSSWLNTPSTTVRSSLSRVFSRALCLRIASSGCNRPLLSKEVHFPPQRKVPARTTDRLRSATAPYHQGQGFHL
jgi:hypothetical protein